MSGGAIAVYALKGGVGKTTAAVNLAYAASSGGARVALWDLDPQQAATFLLRVKPRLKGGTRALLDGETDPLAVVRESAYSNLSVLPAEGLYRDMDLDLDAMKKSEKRVARIVEVLNSAYDVVILDCPPGLSLLSTNVVRAARLLVVPVVPSPLSLRTLDQVVDFAQGVEGASPAVLAFLSMVDRRRALHRKVVELVGDRHRDMARTTIPLSATAERMSQRRAPLSAWAARTPVAQAYEQLWVEVQERTSHDTGREGAS